MKILVPVDGSELALNAVRHAIRLTQDGLKASFVLATVQVPALLYEMLLAPGADVLERVTGAVGSHALADAQKLFEAAGVDFVPEIGSGDPAQTLLEICLLHNCEAIILGARGLGALSGALMGSVSQAVLHSSTVPVTIVKHAPSGAQTFE